MDLQRISLVGLSLIFKVKDILHSSNVNTIDETYQANTYREEVPYYVKVLDSYDDVYKEGAYLPSVVVDVGFMSEDGLQIGGGKNSYRNWDVEVFATGDVERDALITIIYEELDGGTSVRDFNVAFPEYVYNSGEGRIIETFSGQVPNSISDLIVESKSIEYIPKMGTEDVDSHRAVIRVRTKDLR